MKKTIANGTSTNTPSHIQALFNQLEGTSRTNGDMLKKNVMAGQKQYTLMVSQTDPSILTICEKSETVALRPLLYIKEGPNGIRLGYPKNAVPTNALDQHLMVWEIMWKKTNHASCRKQGFADVSHYWREAWSIVLTVDRKGIAGHLQMSGFFISKIDFRGAVGIMGSNLFVPDLRSGGLFLLPY